MPRRLARKVGSGVDLDSPPGALLGDRQIAARSPDSRSEERNVCLALDVLAVADLFAEFAEALCLVEAALSDCGLREAPHNLREDCLVPRPVQQLVGLAKRFLAMLHVAGPRADVPDAVRSDRVFPLLPELVQVVPIRAHRLERTVELAQPGPHVGMKMECELLNAGDVTEPLDELVGVAHTLLDPPRPPDEVRRPHRR